MEKSNTYYAVIFTASGTEETLTPEYIEMETRLYEKAKTLPGFININTVKDSDRNEITVSYWRDLGSIRKWSMDPDHQMAKDAAPGKYYNNIKLEITKVERVY